MNQKISDNYLKLQKELHKNPNYGVASIKFAPNVKKIFEDAKLFSISDYGAGKKNLQNHTTTVPISTTTTYYHVGRWKLFYSRKICI